MVAKNVVGPNDVLLEGTLYKVNGFVMNVQLSFALKLMLFLVMSYSASPSGSD